MGRRTRSMCRLNNARLRGVHLHELLPARLHAVLAHPMRLREVAVEFNPFVPGHTANAHRHAGQRARVIVSDVERGGGRGESRGKELTGTRPIGMACRESA